MESRDAGREAVDWLAGLPSLESQKGSRLSMGLEEEHEAVVGLEVERGDADGLEAECGATEGLEDEHEAVDEEALVDPVVPDGEDAHKDAEVNLKF